MSLSEGGIKTGASMLFRDESEGYLFTALAVPGMKMARAWLGLCNGTGELLDATGRWPVEVAVYREVGKWQIHKPQSTGSVSGGRNVP